jgi:hypothetical protein
MLDHREEFSGQTFHFVDPEPVELADLILTIKNHLQVKHPRKVYVPYSVAQTGRKIVRIFIRLFTKMGLRATLPPELMFLGAFYRTQTLSGEKLSQSSFVDPMPEETVYSRLPEMIYYYLTRWSHQNLITTFNEELEFDISIQNDFQQNPQKLLDSIHLDATAPFEIDNPETECRPNANTRN